MPRIVVTEGAARGLGHCRLFLAYKSPRAATRAGQLIIEQLAQLETQPEMGRPFDELPELRELIIPFGEAGYVAFYRYDIKTDLVYILAFRHQKEAGY